MLLIMNINHTFQKSILCSKTKRNICFMFHKILLTNHLKSWSFQYQIVKWFIIIYYIYFYSCYFDAVKGAVANIFFTTVPMTTVLVANVVLYVLTWWKIHTESKRIKTMLGNEAQTVRASHKAAKLMSLFVAAFFVQWWALGIAIVWYKFAVVPKEFHTITVIFANIGGVVNGFVYIIIQRRKAHHGNKSSKNSGYSLGDSENSQRNVNVSVIDTKV